MLLINYNKTVTDRCSSVDDIYKTQNKGFFISLFVFAFTHAHHRNDQTFLNTVFNIVFGKLFYI